MYKILLLGLFIFIGGYLFAQHDQQYEIFTTNIEGSQLTVLTNMYPLIAGKKVVFTMRTALKDMNNKIQPNDIFLNIINMNTMDDETRLVFISLEKGNEYFANYTFSQSGNYKFRLMLSIVDSSNIVRTQEVSFTQEVKKNESEQEEKSNGGFMGMGTTMMLIMVGVMMVVMAVVVMGTSGHR